MTWFKATSLTIANNSAVATVVSGEDISNIQAGDGLIVGAFTPVEIKRVYIDANNNRFIELVDAWLNATQTAVPSRVLPTSGDFAGAVQALKDATALLSNNFASLDSWYSAMGNVVLTAQNGTEYTARTFKQMDADIQELQDNNQALIDNSVSDTIGKIRYSKLDNPLCHLFKKNKLVDTLKGELSWTRDSGATYIDRYGVLQYSPSPYATNLLFHSENFSNAAWLKSGATSVQDAINHKGKNSAYSVTPDTANARHGVYQEVSVVAGESYTYSTIVKSVELSQIRIYSSNTTYLNLRGYFDISNGIAQSESLAGISYVTYVDNGFYRCEVTNTAIATGTFFMWVAAADNSIDTYVGNDSDSFIIDSCQFEKSKIANGYVKTLGASISGSSYVGIDIIRQEKEGWLKEVVSTNLLLGSSLPNNYYKVHVTSSVENVLPDGISSAALFTGDGVFGEHYCSTSGVVSPGLHTGSVFVKYKDVDIILIRVLALGGSGNIGSIGYFTFSTKSISNGEVEELSNGWFRLSLPPILVIDQTSITCRVHSDQGGETNSTSSVFTAHHQCEPLPSASSYIPTTDAPATRAAENISFDTNGNVPDAQGEWSIVFNAALNLPDTNRPLYQLGNSFANEAGRDGWASYVDPGSDRLRSRLKQEDFGAGSGVVWSAGLQFNTAWVMNKDRVRDFYVQSELGEFVTNDASIVTDLYTDPLIQSSIMPAGLSGHIQDFRIYDFALNADEVAFLAGE
jgi:hypothetical protein